MESPDRTFFYGGACGTCYGACCGACGLTIVLAVQLSLRVGRVCGRCWLGVTTKSVGRT
ncbi:uncharacterized protein K441DRAFT_17350 [Cenococcum geophilum 1.58]|uniref:uncharacterized protein n=1 Tax=Cenococcum geophilum 1.58 TaxID=794803 RepID=UPI00358E1A3E|nr:hypothetical protein K441DRAFT_17350 [Cenococcum geophilum 1.58]